MKMMTFFWYPPIHHCCTILIVILFRAFLYCSHRTILHFVHSFVAILYLARNTITSSNIHGIIYLGDLDQGIPFIPLTNLVHLLVVAQHLHNINRYHTAAIIVIDVLQTIHNYFQTVVCIKRFFHQGGYGWWNVQLSRASIHDAVVFSMAKQKLHQNENETENSK